MRILQVGDVHLASAAQLGRAIDEKDPRFPTGLRNLMAGPPVQTVFRKLFSLLEHDKIASLLFMGDFADRGDLSGFKSCVTYLAESLQVGTGRRFENIPLGLVPGNHDIDRLLAAKPGLKKKFQPLQQAIASAGLPSLPIDTPAWLSAAEGPCRIDIALLNSCWGCGAKENIPAEFRDEIIKAIDSAIGAGTDERAARAYYDRQLDTPAFSKETIQQLIDDVAKLPGASLLLAVAHHNILPQRLTRLAPYTELVNSGALRNTLLELQRPVLYLHGHIHEDPVEILHTPGSSPLVCISAPEASLGFNLLEIVFTAAGLPLTCYLRPFRFDDSGVFREKTRQVIPISGGRRKPADAVRSAIYQKIVSDRDCYWNGLVGCAAAAGADPAEEATEEALELLAADQFVEISNYDVGREHWIVSSKV
jgi:hypothetical protein